jgi:hypothetical protein
VRPDATYAVPGGIDYRNFPIVDVSVEPPDGDPTHSGDSILRGTLSGPLACSLAGSVSLGRWRVVAP